MQEARFTIRDTGWPGYVRLVARTSAYFSREGYREAECGVAGAGYRPALTIDRRNPQKNIVLAGRNVYMGRIQQ